MSIADEVLPPAPDDDDYSPEPTLEVRVQADLVRHTERIAADDRLIARAQAHLTEDQARAAAYNRWDDREVARRTIVSETACLTRVAERTIDRQLDEARFLSSYAPATFAAFSRGEISYRHATPLLGQLLTLPDGGQAAFEEKVLPEAKRLPVGRFRDKARRLRERLHPESIVTRHKNALADRRSYWEVAPDGMAWLHWYGTAHDTKAAYDRINGMAVKLRKAGDPTPADQTEGTDDARTAFGLRPDATEELPTRTLDQLRADITAALLLDGITPDGMGAGIRGTVMVTVPVLTLGARAHPAGVGRGPRHPRRVRAHLPGGRTGDRRARTELHPAADPPGNRGGALTGKDPAQEHQGHEKVPAGAR
ncbi:hypothetical protein C3B59_17775 [Cryobacterium zongtaii]|uniref:DUF222 domain-containing protein n=1 Tax=Cryobacterium zongtaii TaxID=1259217 RepID=A0A2S3Z568_9MICO|nr:DUF222 domain-containing protein [Cryobacterium zongtaii]POH59077.1 hypothetical protein C3B59_17775 [Cryobacterium zongtaii]